ncbi:MAG: STAS-like domain-containing protein, partial [Pseudomonadota bacterium]|nr:STAS-like domain-containing protein [Pseudomonadota bacterium]
MSNQVIINVANDFYPRPAGRFITDGDYSGEAFREGLLKNAITHLKKFDKPKLVIDFHGVTMAGSSFLEEAFGGLVRKGYISKPDLQKKLLIESHRTVIE